MLYKSNPVVQNRTAWGTRLRLREQEYLHGLYMDTPTTLLVRLARPAEVFTAVVGIDNNQNTRRKPDKGSARFHGVVGRIGRKRVSSTPVRRLRSEPVRLEVPLEGATEFLLRVDNADDGCSYDQCSWAEAAVRDFAQLGINVNAER